MECDSPAVAFTVAATPEVSLAATRKLQPALLGSWERLLFSIPGLSREESPDWPSWVSSYGVREPGSRCFSQLSVLSYRPAAACCRHHGPSPSTASPNLSPTTSHSPTTPPTAAHRSANSDAPS